METKREKFVRIVDFLQCDEILLKGEGRCALNGKNRDFPAFFDAKRSACKDDKLGVSAYAFFIISSFCTQKRGLK